MPKPKNNTLFIAALSVAAASFIHAGYSGAKIEYDLNHATAKLKAEFRFFGNIRPDVIKKAIENIEKQWSGKPTLPDDTAEYDLYLVHKGRLSLSTQLTYTVIPSIDGSTE